MSVAGLVGLPIAGFHSFRGCVLRDAQYQTEREKSLTAELEGLKAAQAPSEPSEGPGLKNMAKTFNQNVQQLNISLKEKELIDASADNLCISHNKWSFCPLVNLAMGAHKIYEAIFTDGSQYGVPEERETHFRIWMFIMGVLELTWIGGIAAHLIAEAYFSCNPTQEGEAYEVVT